MLFIHTFIFQVNLKTKSILVSLSVFLTFDLNKGKGQRSRSHFFFISLTVHEKGHEPMILQDQK